MGELSVCDGCGAQIVDHVHSLLIRLDGWGDSGMLDTFSADDGVAVELCDVCARPLMETRWGAKALPFLNINVGHVCPGTLSWVPQPGCENDVDRHGWRPVFVVRPDVDERSNAKLPHFGMFSVKSEAERFATEIRRSGINVRVVGSLIGNERNIGVFVDPEVLVAQNQQAGDASDVSGSLDAASVAARQMPTVGEPAPDVSHVPADAGLYADGLARILNRIPAAWGRYIDCGPGWYPLLVQLEQSIAEIASDFEVHQAKEKFGTLRFYWGMKEVELDCCATFNANDPRPQLSDTGRFELDGEALDVERRLLEVWWERSDEHLSSAEHQAAVKAASHSSSASHLRSIVEHIDCLADAAEAKSASICERCGAPGSLQSGNSWMTTVCESCAQ